MKALFLDVDGVLNSTRSTYVKIGPTIVNQAVLQLSDIVGGLGYGVTYSLRTVDPICVALVNELLMVSGATLVLSSTHRKFFVDEHTPFRSEKHLTLLRHYLEVMGVYVPEHFDITPELHLPRGSEVDEWIANSPVDVQEYVILDDGRDFSEFQPLVNCDPEHGIDFANFAEACKYLGTKEPSCILL